MLVILDGVPSVILQRLREQLAAEPSFSIAAEDWYLSLLPTTTSVNKASLLSGQLPDKAAPPSAEGTAKALKMEPMQVVLRAEPRLSPAEIDGLQPGHMLAWHCLGVDQDLLHRPKHALDRWLEAYAAVGEVATRLVEFARGSSERGLPVWIGCINDHGWTELPTSARAVEVPDELAASVAHGRVIKGLADDTYGIALGSAPFFLDEPCTVARGYSYFERRPHGAVHGGATPQEVATFGFWATNTELPKLRELGLQVVGEIRRGTARNRVALRLVNPNGTPVEVTAIEFTAVEVSTENLPLAIPASGQGELPIVCDASAARDDLSVRGNIRWRCRGRSQIQSVSLPVPTSGAARAKRAFEDMFDR